jgi:predicted PurR-regulated permease PerM
MGSTAKRTAVATLVAASLLALMLALWQLRVLVSLFLLGLVIAAAMRPTVEWLRRHGVPGGIGIALHYLALLGLLALLLWFVVPAALDQLGKAAGGLPTSTAELHHAATHSTGFKHEVLSSIDKRLRKLPSGTSLLHPAVSVGTKAFEAIVAIFFVFATAAYWVYERDRARRLIVSLVPLRHRRTVHDTWELIDLKLGAFVRGQLLLVGIVATVLSLGFWAIGEPYWLLIGVFGGIVELIPIVGPISAGGLAIAAGFVESWHVALLAGLVVFAVRMLEDYVVIPKVLGHAVGLSPLVVLVSVTAFGLLLGGLYLLLATPIAAIVATLIDVIVRDRDPADEEVPALIFSGQDTE